MPRRGEFSRVIVAMPGILRIIIYPSSQCFLSLLPVLTRLASYFPMPSIPAGLSNVLHCSFMSVSYKLFSSPAGSGKSVSGGHVMLCPVRAKAFPTPDGFCRSAAVYCSSSVAVRWFQPVVPLIQVSPLWHNESKETPAPWEKHRFFFRELGRIKMQNSEKYLPKPVVHVAS